MIGAFVFLALFIALNGGIAWEAYHHNRRFDAK